MAASRLRTLPPDRRLLLALGGVELCFVVLMAVAPLGGVTQTRSPLARVWPWLLAPAHLIFGTPAVGVHTSAEHAWPALVLFAALLVAASCAAAFGVYAAQRLAPRRRGLLLVVGGAVVLGVTCALLPTLPSDDVFSYILYGRISALHGANPLIATPADFPHDPFLPLVYWRGVRSVYGPAWLLLSEGLTHLAEALGGSLAVYVALFKLLGLIAHLANTLLIWGILGRLAPSRRLTGTLFYAWNPLCLLEFCASAHNDALMLTFALIGVYWFVRGQEAPAIVAFGLSIATKYVLLAVMPFYLLFVYQRLRREGAMWRDVVSALGWRLTLLLGTVVLIGLPYWEGPRTLGALLYSPPAQQLDNSLLEVAQWPLRTLMQVLGLSPSTARSLVQTGLKLAALAGFAAIWLSQLRRVRDPECMLTAWTWALFGYVVVASVWFWPWYATWVVVFAALLPWGMLPEAALLLAAGALTLYAFLPLYSAGVYGVRSLLVFGPALAYLAWRLRQRAGTIRPARRDTVE